MSLRKTVALPFKQRGTRTLPRSEFAVSLTLDNDWFTPPEVDQLVSVARSADLLTVENDSLSVTFDPSTVAVPTDFTPDESVLRERTVFEAVLDELVAAGHDKQTAVGEINATQAALQVTIEAAAVVTAHRAGVDVDSYVGRAEAAVRDR